MSTQADIIARFGVQAKIDPEQEIRKSIDFVKDYFKAHTFLKAAVLGISGGQDSTLTGKLVQMALAELRQETGIADYAFIAVRLPYGEQIDAKDVEAAIDWIRPDETLSINIKAAVDAMVASLSASGLTISDFNKGNIKARQRMISQYAIAGERAGVVIGTDHAAESITGFYTKYGDGAADIEPLYRLDKRQGRQMLVALEAPEQLISKVPTADLEDNKPLVADEIALGVSYDSIDDYLEGKKVASKDQTTIERLYHNSEHKRQLPITIFDDFWKK